MDFRYLPFYIFCAFGIGMLLMFAGSVMSVINRGKRFRLLLESLGAKAFWLNSGQVSVDGRDYILSFEMGSRNSPSRFTITTMTNLASTLSVRREGKIDQFFKNIGLNKEIQLHDPDFDNDCYLEGEDEKFAREILGSVEVRAAVKRLLEKFTAIEFQRNFCQLRLTPFTKIEFLSQPFLQQALGDFERIVQGLPPAVKTDFPIQNQVSINYDALPPWVKNTLQNLTGAPLTASSNPTQGLPPGARDRVNMINAQMVSSNSATLFPGMGPAMGLSAAVFGGGMILFFFSAIFCPLVYPFLIWQYVGILALILGGFILSRIFEMVRGHPSSAKIFGLSMIFVISGSVFLSVAILVLSNAIGDPSSPSVHSCTVSSKRVSHSSKNGDSYYVSVSPWEPGQSSYEFSVNGDEYANHNIPHKTIYRITTKKGNFGFEWIAERKRLN